MKTDHFLINQQQIFYIQKEILQVYDKLFVVKEWIEATVLLEQKNIYMEQIVQTREKIYR